MNMNHTSRFFPTLIIVGMFFALLIVRPGAAHASGGGDPVDSFVSRPIPDIHPNQYEQGDLGIILPSYQRLYLYPAWRAIVLGRPQAKTQTKAGGLERAVLINGATGWYTATTATDSTVVDIWNAASRPYAGPGRKEAAQDMRNIPNAYSSYIVCASSAFTFATETLNAIKARKDTTPERIQSWVAAQDNVFQFCDYDPNPAPYARNKATAAPSIPMPLPRTEPDYWQQLRQYQIAAAHFYNDAFPESARLFRQIGTENTHPMRVWGSYLALRAQLRTVELSREPDERRKKYFDQVHTLQKSLPQNAFTEQRTSLERDWAQTERQWKAKHLDALERDATQILNEASLGPVHEATRALLRRARARLAPQERIAELAKYLDDPSLNPHQDDHLFDWAFLVAGETEYGRNKAFLEEQYQHHPFMRWIDSVQQCGQSGDTPNWGRRGDLPSKEQCHAQYLNAMSQWKESAKAGKHGNAAAWMVASLMLATELAPELEKAALAADQGAPEYLTVRYHLARLYRLAAGKTRSTDGAEPEPRKKARVIVEDALKSGAVHALNSTSVVNLLKQERFAAATSVADATTYLLRRKAEPWITQASSSRTSKAGEAPAVLQADGVRWLNGQLSLQDLLGVAQDQGLPVAMRAQLATAVWLRADLLSKWRIAEDAAQLVGQLSPPLNVSAASYLQTQVPEQKHHLMLLTAMRFRLSAYATTYSPPLNSKDYTQSSPSDTTASMWCSLPENSSTIYEAEAEHVPEPLTLTSDPTAREEERNALSRLKSATGHVGDHVLHWASTQPKDPDLPWLLHVVVQSTRGGCLDKDSSTLSKTAFRLLHKRFPGNEWTRATPYWY